MKTILHITISLILFSHSIHCIAVDQKMIPEDSLKSLKTELAELKTSRNSSSAKRRVVKGVIRKAQELIKVNPEAENRFQVLAFIMNSQQSLLGMENNKRNRDAFYKTCEALAKAPDEYSEYRLKAELILSERDLSSRDADAVERAKALKDIIKGYRDTPGELESLMAGISIATQLGDYDLKGKFLKAMRERFAGDSKAIAYRRKLIGATKMDILFTGIFERLDGTSISFPIDRLGHPYYVIFWSKESPTAIAKLKQLKKQQDEYPELIEIYSMNLDEVPDAGNSIIKEIGLKCTVLKLPGGKNSDAFLTYAINQPSALRVNQYGHLIIPPTITAHTKNEADSDEEKLPHSGGFDGFAFPVSKESKYRLSLEDCDRLFQQIQSLFIGDVLVLGDGWEPIQGKSSPNTINPETISAIRVCFVKPPMRYRLTKEQALENYRKADELSYAAITEFPEAKNLWRVRNYRIIALIGMANLKANPEFFEKAVKEAKINSALPLPKGAAVIPQFCLAIDKFRKKRKINTKVLEDFIAKCKDPGPIAYCAATILSMYADSRDLYNKYRNIYLASKDLPSDLDSFTSFLKDRYHQFYVFKGSPSFYLYSRIYRFVEQNYIVDNSLTPMKEPFPEFDLKTLDGKTLSLPDTKTDVLTVVVFVEPPASGDELPGNFYSPPQAPTKKRPNPQPGGELGDILAIEKKHVNKGVRVITVFLSDDVKQIKAIRDRYDLNGTIAILPGGITNPAVNQLGILSADRSPNVLLIRRNGTIAWRKNGLIYQMVGKNRHHVASNGLRQQIVACDAEAGARALQAKNYIRAKRLFSETLAKTFEGWHKWNSSLAHGRALADFALKDYESALKEIDTAIEKHLKRGQFNHDPERPCSSMIHMHSTRAKILDALGRKSEALRSKNKAALKPTDYPTTYSRVMGFNRPYEAFEERLSIIAKEIE